LIHDLRITMLAENTAGGRDLLAEHGLAYWIEADGRKILFDTGQGLALEHNAKRLGVELESAQAAALSHGHYDHAGGLARALPHFRNADLYVHPAAFDPKFVRAQDGTARPVSSSIRNLDEIRPHLGGVHLTEEPTAICDGVWMTGQIPRRNPFEDTGGPFFCDQACSVPDPLLDDQALYINSIKGLIVLLGCAHSGLVNTLEYVAKLADAGAIHAVLGGMHLVHASYERIAKSEEALQRYDVQLIGPAHCTGRKAVTELCLRFPGRCVECYTGTRFLFG
jgi:7,8-dihydropterin-6-yl-methyl-4-(beta-D-ribofuranosyl)aminobenzene 5'-phosphate synthase